MEIKKKLYNVALCYHGISETQEGALTFRTYIEDFKTQIQLLQGKGYVFVSPTDFYKWYEGTFNPSYPIATIHFDDALDTVELAGDWLVQENIPFGIPIIAKRQGKRMPESGFLPWAKMQEYTNSGLMEVMYHTYNGHHVILSKDANDNVVSSPLLERPAWQDNGMNMYLHPDDPRWYFDFGIIDNTWGFPLFGTDPNSKNPITSKMEFTATQTMSAQSIRMWACLHFPASVGYDAEITVTINGQTVFDGIFYQTHYETRSQWKEREFTSINFDTPFDFVAGNNYTVEFETKNTDSGAGAFRIYSIPEFDVDFNLYTSCTEQDFPPSVGWNARPCIIFSDGTGRTVTDEEYAGYINEDFVKWETSIFDYLNCQWTDHTNYTLTEFDNLIVIGGTYSDGSLADTWLRYEPQETFTAELFSLHYGKRWGLRYPVVIDMTVGEYAGEKQYANEVQLARFSSNWADYKQIDIDIKPFTFEAGKVYYVRFKTLNRSYEGQGLVTVTYERFAPPEPYWDSTIGGWNGTQDYSHTAWGFTTKPEGTDLYPTGWYVDSNGDWQWEFADNDINGHPRISFLDKVSSPTPAFTQVCFPFGAYYENGTGTSYIDGSKEVVHPILKGVIESHGYTGGWSIYPTRLMPKGNLREPSMRHDQFALPRLLIYGNVPNDIVMNNIEAYIGSLFPQTQKGGVDWQVSAEYDLIGNSTIRNNVLDFVAFDAYYCKADGTIMAGEINATDKLITKQRGAKALLIISNYDFAIGEPNGDIAHYVLQNQDVYIPQIVDLCVTGDWDGITINLEWVWMEDKELMNEFIKKLSRELHSRGKLLHQTAPAITGTDYDFPWWTGWCDYATLIKYVDCLKIMSYTEAVDDQPPQPHAPDSFFKQVYDYVNSVVSPKFRRRILVGANTFGRMWWRSFDVTTNQFTYEGWYVNYPIAIAEAIKVGARIIPNQNGEAYWEKDHLSCYFGTPLTTQRAVEMAKNNGYAGVGIWKADDGDILEHYPTVDTPKIFKNNNKISEIENITWN